MLRPLQVFHGDSNALKMSMQQARQMFEANRNFEDEGQIGEEMLATGPWQHL